MNIYSHPIDEVFESLKTMEFHIKDYHSLEKYEQIGFEHTEDTKKAISTSLKSNTNKIGKTGYKLSDEFREKQRQLKLKNNPMFNCESVDKIRQKAYIKLKCPHCELQMNKGNLSKHNKIKH